ncbi:MAG: hypothetical protein Ct9H90mP20_5990 [Candidatus Neomarinimicrobiota bacterium]|nr:MAG: hypothetical protein Ct9H90mP20_5990 [Candidatus Neomarinimicrobiota bacterium]
MGFKNGDKFTPHHLVVDYLFHVSQNEPNVKIIEYGKTYEGRPLMLAFFSSVDNMDKLEQIRKDNLTRAGIIKRV